MGFGKFFKTLGKDALKLADIGHSAGVPVLSQIDTVADAVAGITVTKKIDKTTINDVLTQLESVKSSASELAGNAHTIDYKRLKMALVNVIAVAIIYAGLPADVANNVAMYVTGPILAFILGDTFRKSNV